MLFAWLVSRRSSAPPATPEKAYLAAVSQRLLLAPRRRAACLAELGDHLAQRATTAPSRSLAEVVSRMGSPQMVASQLNAAAPWWQSRPSGRLYAAALGLLVLLSTLQYCILEMIGLSFPNGQYNYGIFPICYWVVFPAASLAMPALVALLARRWCVSPLQAAVPVCLLLILQMSVTTWTAVSCLLDAFGNHAESAMARDSLAYVFERKVPAQMLSWGVFVGPCALLLSMLKTQALARWSLPALALPVVLAAVGGRLEYSDVVGMPSAIMWLLPLGAALGVAPIAVLIRRGGLQAA
jgi:hypothetical protein